PNGAAVRPIPASCGKLTPVNTLACRTGGYNQPAGASDARGIREPEPKANPTRGRTEQTMASFNKVILMGNLTRDPELRSTPGGAQLAEITLAVNDVYTDKS